MSVPRLPARRGHALALLAAICTFGTAMIPSVEATAEQVTIRVKGGGLEVKGELRSFDGTRYVIEAPQLGLMSFDASRIDCIGDACAKRVTPPSMPYEPLSAAAPETVVLRGPAVAGEALLPLLIRGYAAAIGATVVPVVGTAAGETQLRLTDSKGATLATFVMHASDATPVEALTQGGATIALMERTLGDDEIKALTAANPDFKAAQHEHAIAGDGLALVVSPESPALALSEDNLARILAGKASSWIDVGIAGGKITVYAAGKGGALAQAINLLLKPRGLQAAAAITELATESDVADAVARDAGGLGIVSFAVQRNARRLNIEGPCGIITRPSTFAVKAGEWPLARRLVAVTAGPPRLVAARDLLRFATSKEAQALLAEAQFIDNGVESQAVEEQTGRMAAAVNAPPQAFDMGQMRELLADIKGARRLSLTFRFQPGTIDLDAPSRRDIARLAELLQQPELQGQHVQLIGFTDAEGKLATSVTSSAKRAAQLRTGVLAAAGKLANPALLAAKGHGALAPVVCNDTAEHRQLNRRIEVWARQP